MLGDRSLGWHQALHAGRSAQRLPSVEGTSRRLEGSSVIVLKVLFVEILISHGVRGKPPRLLGRCVLALQCLWRRLDVLRGT
jgi:hypothetical protein